MITPADLAHMIANASGDHAQNPDEPDTLLYSSRTARATPDAVRSRPNDNDTDRSETTNRTADTLTAESDTRAARAAGSPSHVRRLTGAQAVTRIARASGLALTADTQHFIEPDGGPTPKMMPHRRSGDGPTKFATLDAQELPIAREYSAGGLIFDDRGRVAIIARHSRSGHLEWCLPKGHIEKGETPEQTAVREVHEETGILGEVVSSIATIDYWFTGTVQRVHKLVHHFALRQIGGELTVEGDPDHEAEDAIWMDFNDLESVLSYPNERKIVWLYTRKLNRQAEG